MKYVTLSEALNLFAQIADSKGEQYRANAYRRAIIAPDETGADLARKIAEYRASGRIRELDNYLAQEDTRAWLQLSAILGFGPSTIRTLIARGIKTPDQLLSAVRAMRVKLNRVQTLGLQYHNELSRKIPREEVTSVSELIFLQIYRVAEQELGTADMHRVHVVTAGSYRRHARESNDVDILVTCMNDERRAECASKDQTFAPSFLRHLHEALRQTNAYVDVIALGKQKYSFLYRHRWVISIDIIYVPCESYYAALLYFTGSQIFNIWLREECKKKGYSLNQYGLVAPDGALRYLRSEEEIFDIIGIPYVPPQLRDNVPQMAR